MYNKLACTLMLCSMVSQAQYAYFDFDFDHFHIGEYDPRFWHDFPQEKSTQEQQLYVNRHVHAMSNMVLDYLNQNRTADMIEAAKSLMDVLTLLTPLLPDMLRLKDEFITRLNQAITDLPAGTPVVMNALELLDTLHQLPETNPLRDQLLRQKVTPALIDTLIRQKQSTSVQQLVSSIQADKALPEAVRHTLYSSLMQAVIQNKDITTLNLLIRGTPPAITAEMLNTMRFDGYTPLIRAVQQMAPKMITTLLNAGCDPLLTTSDGESATMMLTAQLDALRQAGKPISQELIAAKEQLREAGTRARMQKIADIQRLPATEKDPAYRALFMDALRNSDAETIQTLIGERPLLTNLQGLPLPPGLTVIEYAASVLPITTPKEQSQFLNILLMVKFRAPTGAARVLALIRHRIKTIPLIPALRKHLIAWEEEEKGEHD